MKKFLLLASALFALSTQAQVVKFVHVNETIEQGSTYTCYDWEDDGFGEFLCDPEISLLSSENITVRVAAKCTSGHEIQLCIGGGCVKRDEVITDNINLTAGVALPTRFDTSYYEEQGPQTIISTLAVYENGTDNLINSITVICDAKSNSVELFEADDNSVVSAEGKLVYKAEATTTLALYSTDGNCMLKNEVAGNGELSTAGLDKGVYIYTIGKKSGKLIIK